jgi:6-pyruvoyltetrahydropterin/6-carboxytetrahydropterin synthase
VISLTRCYRLPAAHVLAIRGASDAENRRIYGKCANPAGHGHDYGFEVTVRGPVDERSGRVIDPARLDALFEERVGRRLAHRLLNEVPLFAERDLVPTAENVARVAFEQLAGPVAESGAARLVRVRVVETRRNSFVYGEVE